MADPNMERDPLEVLAAEYMDRLRKGELPSVEEFAGRHPSLAEEIRELFPTIAATERLKARQQRSSDGRATLGPARLERLGDFRLIRELGRGGMGVVFEAEQESLGRRVAVKVLPKQVLLDEKHLRRFEREARIAASLHHTNIVQVFGVGEQDGFHYYVMQYIEGVGLDTVVPEIARKVRDQVGGRPPSFAAPVDDPRPEGGNAAATIRQLLGDEDPQDGRPGPAYWCNVARIGLQAAEALSHAHGQGVLHRDIKPANLLLGAQATVWLADFGLACVASSDDVSLSRDVVGTLRYMPPERFQGRTDHRSDIYSLGLTLYELLALRPAYEETDQSRLMQRIAQGPPDRPGNASLEIPRDLETIVLKAVSHEPGQRYQTARAMADDLQCFLEDRPIQARRVGSVERLGRWCRRNKSLAVLTGTTLFLIITVAVVASIGYVRTKTALQGEAAERAKAEANARLAIEALDRMFERFAPGRMRVLPPASAEASLEGGLDLPASPALTREAAALLEEMLPFYDRLAQQTGNSEELRFRTAEANQRVGAIRQRLGHTREAVRAYQRAIELFRGIGSRFPNDSDLALKIAQVENELGRLFTSERQFAKARQAHLSALALLQTRAAHPSAPRALQFELARTYFLLGLPERPLPTTVARQGGGLPPESNERRDSFNKAVALLRALAATLPADPECQHLLALCYLEGAPVPEDGGPGAWEGGERAIAVLEDLVKRHPGVADYAYDLSEAYVRMHIPSPPMPPHVERAFEERLGKALVLLEQLVSRHPDVPDYLAFKARVHHKLGYFCQQTARWPDAESSFRDAIACQGQLLGQFPDVPQYSAWMATYRFALADVLIRQGQLTTARADLEETLAALQAQLGQRPEMNSLHDLLASGYSQLEGVFRQIGEMARADEAARNAQTERDAARHSP